MGTRMKVEVLNTLSLALYTNKEAGCTDIVLHIQAEAMEVSAIFGTGKTELEAIQNAEERGAQMMRGFADMRNKVNGVVTT
jgi:hypothetical protein